MVKKIYLFLILGLFLINFTSAETYNEIGTLSTDVDYSVKSGVNFTVTSEGITNITIQKFYAGTGTNATMAYLYFANGTTLIQQADFVGVNATINYTLTSGQSYIAVVDRGGVGYSYGKSTTFGGFPKASSNVTFVNSIYDMTDYNTGIALSIEGIWTWKSVATPTFPTINVSLISPNATTSSINNTNFTAFFNITGTNSQNISWKNATYYIWYNDGTLYNNTTMDLAQLNNTNSQLNLTNMTIGSYIWNVNGCYANDTYTACNLSETNYTFNIGASLSSLTLTNNTYETAEQTIMAIFNSIPGSQIALAKMVYNGTNYTISNITNTSLTFTLTKTFQTPLNVNATANQTNDFYFVFTYAGNFTQNSETYEQNVSFIDLRLCAPSPYNLTSLNFTLKDEINQTLIVPVTNPTTMQTTFNYWLGNGSVYKKYSYQSINSSVLNNYTFCIYPYYPNNFTFKADLDSSFSAMGYSENEYHLRNATLTNNTADFDLFLYILDATQATKFYVTIQQGINFISEALVTISKYFIGEGVYKTTSIKISDDDGKFPLFVDLDGKYKFTVVQDSILLGVVEKTMTCESAPCTITINLNENFGSYLAGWETYYAQNVLSNLTYNATTKMVEYTFLDITGLANYFRLVVSPISYNTTTATAICDTTTYSSTGTITCNMTGYSGDFIAKGFISRSPEKADKIISFFLSGSYETLGLLGIFLNIAILLTVLLASAAVSKGNPAAIMFSLGIAILLLKISTLFPLSWTLVATIEVVFIYLIMKSKT